MKVVVVPTGTVHHLFPTDDDGRLSGQREECIDLAASVYRIESADRPRWIWESTARTYGPLLEAGVRVDRCHDLSLAEGILAVRRGEVAPLTTTPEDDRPGLFDAYAYPNSESILELHRRHVAESAASTGLRLLFAAESAGALAAAEMSHAGLPFSEAAHHRYLEAMLGRRPRDGELPPSIIELESEISAVFGRRVNPSSHLEIIAAFAREDIELTSTRAHVLRAVDHPAVPLLLRHRDLSKLFSTNGWAWSEAWVRQDRFRPVYVPGAVVSGRWASRGGGGLQIPKPLRSSVIAEPGHDFVIADAGQLEPRILAAMSADPAMTEAAGTEDLYAPVAQAAFGGDRNKAKVAILGVLYGATSGESRSLLTLLRRRFPQAVEYVERAARSGERGEVVHSWLGRACPQPSAEWWAHGDAHARGRFTRNFLVQATASEWAVCLLAELRKRLAAEPGSGELVFFQHDEVVVHSSDSVTARRHIEDAALSATLLLFGDTAVRFPMDVAVRSCYADPED